MQLVDFVVLAVAFLILALAHLALFPWAVVCIFAALVIGRLLKGERL
jgi:hypothetical protein